MDQRLYDSLAQSPVIAAVKDMDGLEACCELEDIGIVFILFGDVCTISDIVRRIKAAGKIAMVHLDLIAGLSAREISVDFIRKNTEADGILSTKPALVKRAKELSLYAVLRYFILDSMALENIDHQQKAVKPDLIEVLPGAMPKVIKKICAHSQTPVIAGGLINDKEDVMGALSAGAVAVSSSNRSVWLM